MSLRQLEVGPEFDAFERGTSGVLAEDLVTACRDYSVVVGNRQLEIIDTLKIQTSLCSALDSKFGQVLKGQDHA